MIPKNVLVLLKTRVCYFFILFYFFYFTLSANIYEWEPFTTYLSVGFIKHNIFSQYNCPKPEGNGPYTSAYYKPTFSHSYLLYSSLLPSHVKNSIPFS